MSVARLIALMGQPAYLPESIALFARMSPDPGRVRKRQIDQLMRVLVGSGAFAQMDAFFVFAASNTADADLNWVASDSAVPSGTLTFAADVGYTGDATTGYLTGPVTSIFENDQHHFGVWQRTAGTTGRTQIGVAANTSWLSAPSGGASNWSVESSASLPTAVVGIGVLGHCVVSREDSTGFNAYRNGVGSSVAQTRNAGVSPRFGRVFARATSPAATQLSDAQLCAAHYGGALTAAQVLAVSDGLSDYLTAVGAI